jgi:flagellar biosynthesis protein FlhG
LIFDQNKEKPDMEATSEEPLEKAQSTGESSVSGRDGQKEKFALNLAGMPAEANTPVPGPQPGRIDAQAPLPSGMSPLKPTVQTKQMQDTGPRQPTEETKPAADPFADRTAAPIRARLVASAPTSAEQAGPLPTAASSNNSPMPVRLPADEPKTNPEASAGEKTDKKIIAVGGAKGGVGKSMLAANLSVGLALLGQKVVLADLDLGGADVHLYTGVKSLDRTWNDFLDKKVDSLNDILTPTAFKGLSLIGGDSSKLGSANLPYSQKQKIMRHLKELETDFLVVDLGGDTTYNGLDFFLLADQKIVVSGTEPASILDSYTFIKVVFNRLIERFFSDNKSLKDLAAQVKDGSLEKSKNYCLDYIVDEVRRRDSLAAGQLKKLFDQFRLSIVLNMTESSKDVRVAESMQKLVKDKCFVDIGILGTIPFDKGVRKAARGFTPIVVENPKCQASRNIHQMLAALILNREQERTRAELIHTTNRIRREAKEQIDAGKMTLDGLTVGQINTVFNNTPRLRRSFQKILSVMSG